MGNLVIQGEKRSTTGKNENNRLRSTGKVPANIIWSGKSIPVQFDEAELANMMNSGIRPATLIDLKITGEPELKVYIKEIQRFPGTKRIRHIDFYKVTSGKKIIAKIGIITTGTAVGAKSGGRFEHQIHEIKIKSTPEDIKDVITIDVTDLQVGQSIKISDLGLPKSWDILVNGDPVVTSVTVTKALLAAERAEKIEPKGKAAKKAPAKAPAAGGTKAPAAGGAKAPAAGAKAPAKAPAKK